MRLGDIEQRHVSSRTLPTNVRQSRSLLWATLDDEPEPPPLPSKPFNDSLPQPMYPMHVNQTESIRLHSDLRRFINGELDWTGGPRKKTELELKRGPGRSTSGEPNAQKNSRLPTSRRAKKRAKSSGGGGGGGGGQVKDVQLTDMKAVQVFSPLQQEHAEFFKMLGRRDDTFYVVSFAMEHLMLPASRKNNTNRPRMSLILPAVPVNGKSWHLLLCGRNSVSKQPRVTQVLPAKICGCKYFSVHFLVLYFF